MSVSGRAHWGAAQGQFGPWLKKGVSATSLPTPTHGSKLIGASNLGGSFAVPLSCSVFGRSVLSSFSLLPTYKMVAPVALTGGV